MRISTFQIFNNITKSLQKNMEKLYFMEEQLSSGKKLNRPSDNPVSIARALAYKVNIKDFEQFKRNMEDAQSYLEATEGALSTLTNTLTRARELTLSAVNDTLTEKDRRGIAEEVLQLRNHVLGLANTKYRDRYIFSGMLYDKPAFDSGGNYQGDNNYIEVKVNPDLRVKENITGLEGFAYVQGSHEVVELDSGKYVHYIPGQNIDPTYPETRVYVVIADTDDVLTVESELSTWPSTSVHIEDAFSFDNTIQMMDRLKDALDNNATDRINALVGAIDRAINAVAESRAAVGARMNLIEREHERSSDAVVSLQKSLSKVEDADISEVISEIAKYQTALEALRQSGAHIISRSLLDFLR
ncbi:MAG: flagellar hook-associated protein 3 [Nitrospirae bacterium]|nr:flagellar hook-associated protein 3 [Nitrospirota bacterium]